MTPEVIIVERMCAINPGVLNLLIKKKKEQDNKEGDNNMKETSLLFSSVSPVPPVKFDIIETSLLTQQNTTNK